MSLRSIVLFMRVLSFSLALESVQRLVNLLSIDFYAYFF